jgi:hypothetical protein
MTFRALHPQQQIPHGATVPQRDGHRPIGPRDGLPVCRKGAATRAESVLGRVQCGRPAPQFRCTAIEKGEATFGIAAKHARRHQLEHPLRRLRVVAVAEDAVRAFQQRLHQRGGGRGSRRRTPRRRGARRVLRFSNGSHVNKPTESPSLPSNVRRPTEGGKEKKTLAASRNLSGDERCQPDTKGTHRLHAQRRSTAGFSPPVPYLIRLYSGRAESGACRRSTTQTPPAY